jgi:hypothetical protein
MPSHDSWAQGQILARAGNVGDHAVRVGSDGIEPVAYATKDVRMLRYTPLKDDITWKSNSDNYHVVMFCTKRAIPRIHDRSYPIPKALKSLQT